MPDYKVAIIPARGGSKRIPRKNIALFNGKPLIAYSIETALQSGAFDRVIVSTDDPEIAQCALDFGAEVPFVRPPELSDDYTGTAEVICHALEWLKDSGHRVDYSCCIYATAPFLRPSDICDSFSELKGADANFSFSVTTFPFPIQRALKKDQKGTISMFQPEHRLTRSQDLEEAWHDAGQFYWAKADSWESGKILFSEASLGWELPRHRVQDIDTPEDWTRAELMMKAMELG